MTVLGEGTSPQSSLQMQQLALEPQRDPEHPRLKAADYLLVAAGCILGLGSALGLFPSAAISAIGLLMIVALVVSLARGFLFSLGVWWAYSFLALPWAEPAAPDLDIGQPYPLIHLGPVLLQPGDIIGMGFLVAAIVAFMNGRSARESVRSYPHRGLVIVSFCFLVLVAGIAAVNGYHSHLPGYTRPLRSILTVAPLVFLLLSKPPSRLVRSFAVFLPILAVLGIILGLALGRRGGTGGIVLSSVFLFPLLLKRPVKVLSRPLATALGLVCTGLTPYISLSTVASIGTAIAFTWSDGLKSKLRRRIFLATQFVGLAILTILFLSLLQGIAAGKISPLGVTIYRGSLASFLANPWDYARFKLVDRAYIYYGAIREVLANPLLIEGGRSYVVTSIFVGDMDTANYSHSFPLEVFIEFGLLTGLPFIYLAARAHLDMWRYLSRSPRSFNPEVLFLSCFGLSLTVWLVLYNYALVSDQGFLLWLTAGIVVRAEHDSQPGNSM